MARRRFRYDAQGNCTEILPDTGGSEQHFVRGEISAFVSPIDGSLIDSRVKYEEHCARHNVTPIAAMQGHAKEYDRYAADRQDRALREQLWELTDRALRHNPQGRDNAAGANAHLRPRRREE